MLLETGFIKHVRSISIFRRPQTFKKSVGFRSIQRSQGESFIFSEVKFQLSF